MLPAWHTSGLAAAGLAQRLPLFKVVPTCACEPRKPGVRAPQASQQGFAWVGREWIGSNAARSMLVQAAWGMCGSCPP